MPLIIIPWEELFKNPAPTPQARPYFTDEQWVIMKNRFSLCLSDANQKACCFEGCLAILLCFWCIFLLHPCNVASCFQSNAHQECINLNNELFQGRQVLSVGASGLQCMIDNFPGTNFNNPVMAEAMFTPYANASAGPRIMSVEIPANATPGSTLTVLAPDDVTRVTVTVPPNFAPGQLVQVEY